jgi:hypothetical protein
VNTPLHADSLATPGGGYTVVYLRGVPRLHDNEPLTEALRSGQRLLLVASSTPEDIPVQRLLGIWRMNWGSATALYCGSRSLTTRYMAAWARCTGCCSKQLVKG